jgi:hypothetical protein
MVEPVIVERDVYDESTGETETIPILPATNSTYTGYVVHDGYEYGDGSWVKDAFLSPGLNIPDPVDKEIRYWSTACGKYTSSRLGFSLAVNPKPQFCRYTDIRRKGSSLANDVAILNLGGHKDNGNIGMGSYYSEAIDDNARRIYMTFGVPQFNSLMNFLTNAFDAGSISLARTGRPPSIWRMAAETVGFGIAIYAFTGLALTIWAGKWLINIFAKETNKYYTLKPTMHLYWSTVQNLVNALLVKAGLLPPFLAEDKKKFEFDPGYYKEFAEITGGMINDQGIVDVYKVAINGQAIANKFMTEHFEDQEKMGADQWTAWAKKELTGQLQVQPLKGQRRTIEGYIKYAIQNVANWFTTNGEDGTNRSELHPTIGKDGNKGNQEPNIFEYLDSSFNDGFTFACFEVNNSGSYQESFGNSAVESELSQKINSTSSQIRDLRFSVADGNFAGGTGIGDLIQGVAGAVKDIAMGTLGGLTMGLTDLLQGLSGCGFIDIPKHWQSSSANLPRGEYSMKLISPYGNVISQAISMYVPICMLLAGALPLSTGKASYASPFLVQLYDRGRCQIRLGMISSLSISRGTSHLGFNTRGKCMAYDVSFTIEDLSQLMHMPVNTGSFLEAVGKTIRGKTPVNMGIDEDNVLCDYLATLAGQDIYSQIYPLSRGRMKIATMFTNFKMYWSGAAFASWLHDATTSGAGAWLTLGLPKIVEALKDGRHDLGY